jgi:demethylmenaquinone methyltransferase/2-methoxy-6-polyprenyl-1,4-benzoquinol methylase
MAGRHDLDASFGRQQVGSDERRALIRRVFEAVAPRYDLMNDLMSFGIHRLWKRTLRKRCEEISGKIVDLAGGTGDVARLLLRHDRHVVVCDPGIGMMQAGRGKVGAGGTAPTVSPPPSTNGAGLGVGGPDGWVAGEAEALPFANNSLDLLTISFGIRNVTQLGAALDEIHRVLKPGGRFVCLEFSRPQWWLAPFYDFYSWLVIPRLGAAVARQPIAYQYLVESIRRFPGQREFAALIAASGFAAVRWENLSFGIACLHSGTKPT